MNNRGDIEFALRLRTELEQGQRELQELAQSVDAVGTAAVSSSTQLNQVGESAEQQTDRIRAMVEASLQQQSAADGMAESIQRTATATQEADGAWQQSAAAQTEAMNAYHNAERAVREKAQADQAASEAAAQASVSVDKEAQELQELLGKIDPVIRKLDELDTMEQQLKRSRDAGKIDLDTFDDFHARLQTQRQLLGGTSDAMRVAGITVGEYRQAMRMLPAQFTDIATSLASGMPIWMVAIQQGGQIKDSFGGIGNAARAVVSAISPLTWAIAAATAAIAVGAVAYYQGAKEADAYHQAIVMTGNAAGTTTGQLSDMAEAIGRQIGTTGQAASALAQLAANGKISAAQFEQVGRAALVMNEATGKAIGDTISEFAKLADDPVRSVAKLNEQYNFLTPAIYDQVVALAEEGRAADATALAQSTLADTLEQRAQSITNRLGLLERAWDSLGKMARGAWDEMLNIGRPDSDQQLVEDIERTIALVEKGWLSSVNDYVTGETITGQEQVLQNLRDHLQFVRDRQAAEQSVADEERKNAAATQAYIEAEQAWRSQESRYLTDAQRLEAEIAEARKNGLAAGKSEAEIEQRIGQIRERYSKKTNTDQERRALENYVAGLARQAETLGMTSAQVRVYDLEQKKLPATLRAVAQAHLATIEAFEREQQAIANARTNVGLQAEYLRAAGQTTEAAMLELRSRFEAMRTEFEKSGNEAGLAWIEKLIPVSEAKVRVDEVQRQIERILAEQQRQEQSVNVQQDSGLLTELQARERILDIHRQTYEQLQQIRPVLEEMAQQPGAVGEAAGQALAALDEQAQRLQATTSLLAETLRDGLTTGLADAITGLAKGTMDIRDAINAVAESVANALVRIAAEGMAQSAVNGLSRMFTDVVPAAAQAVTAIGSVSAAKVAADTTMTASGVTAATTSATAQATAATATTAAWTPAAIAASIGSFGSAAAIGLAAVMAALAFNAFAGGGHVRGPGTTTSDSIPALLSDQEFITRAAVVTQPGALNFLEDFNSRGMAALDDWAGVARHAYGGLAGVPAPALPSPGLGATQLAEPAKAGATLKNNVNLYAVQNPDDVAAMAWGKAGQEHYMVYLQQNASSVRQVLGL